MVLILIFEYRFVQSDPLKLTFFYSFLPFNYSMTISTQFFLFSALQLSLSVPTFRTWVVIQLGDIVLSIVLKKTYFFSLKKNRMSFKQKKTLHQ